MQILHLDIMHIPLRVQAWFLVGINMKEQTKTTKSDTIVIKTFVIWQSILIFSVALFFIGMMVYFSLVVLEGESIFSLVFVNIFFSVLSLYLISLELRAIQFAIISKEGILIRCLFYKIVFINWKEIYNIEIKSLYPLPFARPGGKYRKFIVIYTDKKQTANYGGLNKRKSLPPWFILANKKNVEVIIENSKKYRPDINTKLFRKMIEEKNSGCIEEYEMYKREMQKIERKKQEKIQRRNEEKQQQRNKGENEEKQQQRNQEK